LVKKLIKIFKKIQFLTLLIVSKNKVSSEQILESLIFLPLLRLKLNFSLAAKLEYSIIRFLLEIIIENGIILNIFSKFVLKF